MYPIPDNEALRLQALRSYDILDTAPEPAYEGLCYLASLICGTRMAAITLIDEHRQWFKAKQGIDDHETPREHAFCAHAICNPGQVMVVEDARTDDRFQDNPYVLNDPHVRFYAGAPLTTPDGRGLGTICAIHDEPSTFTEDQRRALEALSQQVMMQLELRRRSTELKDAKGTLETVNDELRFSNEELDRFVSVVTHELKDPLSQIVSNLDLLNLELEDHDDAEINELLTEAQTGGERMSDLIRDLSRYARARRDEIEKSPVNTKALIEEVEDELAQTIKKANARITTQDALPTVNGDVALLRRVFKNLIQNAIKYNDAPTPTVRIRYEEEPHALRFFVEDNGIGIPEDEQADLFGVFTRASNTGNREGTGVGLALASRIIERHGGHMTVTSTLGEGSTFHFTLPTDA